MFNTKHDKSPPPPHTDVWPTITAQIHGFNEAENAKINGSLCIGRDDRKSFFEFVCFFTRQRGPRHLVSTNSVKWYTSVVLGKG